MGELFRTEMTLRFGSVDLDPNQITEALGKRLTKQRSVGDPISDRPNSPLAQKGYWGLSATPAMPGDLDTQAAKLFEGATDDLDVWRELARQFDGDLFCGLFLDTYNEGISLLPRTMLSISSRGLLLDLDIYEGD